MSTLNHFPLLESAEISPAHVVLMTILYYYHYYGLILSQWVERGVGRPPPVDVHIPGHNIEYLIDAFHEIDPNTLPSQCIFFPNFGHWWGREGEDCTWSI